MPSISQPALGRSLTCLLQRLQTGKLTIVCVCVCVCVLWGWGGVTTWCGAHSKWKTNVQTHCRAKKKKKKKEIQWCWEGCGHQRNTMGRFQTDHFTSSNWTRNQGFPSGSVSKESACSAGDPSSVPELGRSPGKQNSNPLQYPYLEDSMNRGAWWSCMGPWRCIESDMSEWLTLSLSNISSKSHQNQLEKIDFSRYAKSREKKKPIPT